MKVDAEGAKRSKEQQEQNLMLQVPTTQTE